MEFDKNAWVEVTTRNTFHGDPIGRLCGDKGQKQVDLHVY